MEEDSLYLQLHKLSAINSEEALDHILTTLWKSRRTGLRSPEKSHIQSLLSLPSLSEVDPVLACLRSLIRKSVHERFTGDDLLKLFPPDLSLDLQSFLVLLLQKYQNQWKEEMSKEQHPLPRTSISYQVKASVPPSFSSSEISMPVWPRQDDLNGRLIRNDVGISMSIISDSSASHFAPVTIQHDACPSENLGVLPRLKSMTWTMENHNSAPANRVAIISLKLQDFTRSPSGEKEVKFQLTRDTLEAMLRSMTYISEQLSSMVNASAEPVQKKQKQ
ncbi:uncharacterized protein LOC110621210 isoform X2 [Manihot esculenta]|uniref:Uncharacterized protein n=2 Tax=Manihot esculenta TaxID=3983 RepID=A0A2C9VGK9_MANES|nr:uncharacterized protein LOC110621210 isoform X2 [Manihot esculenta]KAG8649903.1 hypothetical protein MANES_08G155600v8 [Manihot esculenta]OAY44502.1 hypothetical protein MANES_08G155600v8 [Manihot esculenta]